MAPVTASPLREWPFVRVDVFTDRIFGGNPLAVFLDGRGLGDGEMQAIAREMNTSETTFVLPPTRGDADVRVRIFTPARELPFAGHPTIGTAWVLATRGMLRPGTHAIVLEEGVGPVEVAFEGKPDAPDFVWMRSPEARFGDAIGTRSEVATSLGLEEKDLLARAPIETGSSGTPFLYVPLRDRDAVDRAVLNFPALLAAVGPDAAALGIFVFAPDPDPAAGRAYARMFAPRSGITEDPATGSASGPLGAYLVRHRLVAPADEIRVVSEQGTKMGRQSFIHIVVRVSAGRVTDIRVGGGVVPVMEGTLSLP